jgi:hypothetical protein
VLREFKGYSVELGLPAERMARVTIGDRTPEPSRGYTTHEPPEIKIRTDTEARVAAVLAHEIGHVVGLQDEASSFWERELAVESFATDLLARIATGLAAALPGAEIEVS